MEEGRLERAMNILISSAGRRVVLVREFRKALRRLGLKGNVVAVDISRTAPALYAADRAYIVPRVTESDFVATIISIASKEHIGLLVPTIDPELPVYAAHKEEIMRSSGAYPVISSPEVIDTCTDKYRFYRFLTSLSIATPLTWTADRALDEARDFPLFVKPRCGFASVNTCRISDPEELAFFLRRHGDLIVQQCIAGKEYTIDLLSDFQGRVISIVPRERIEVRAGEVTRSRTEKNALIIDASKKIAESLGSTGPITLQCIVKGNVPYFFEINPRVGGGLPASIAAGANTPEKLVRMGLGERLRPVIGRFKENHFMMRYDDAIFRSSLLAGGVDIWRER
jgi:carbamoyl-phosphate synthase large subunit